MEKIKIEGFSFTYPGENAKTLDSIDMTIEEGDFVTIFGRSGSGKSTLLRNLKPYITPYGEKTGRVLLDGVEVGMLSHREQCEKIGFVLQNPDNQIVTDKVWHELAFGLENLGLDTNEIRGRVAEMAAFFGIEDWFHKKVVDLSGGQKQLLNLASVMVMQPEVLVLDEPTSQLDPIAASEFLQTVSKINKELGTTIVLSEHRLEEALNYSTQAVVIDKGRIVAEGTPRSVAAMLKKQKNDMFAALPVPMRIYGALEDGEDFPLSISQGRRFLLNFSKKGIEQKQIKAEEYKKADIAIKLEDIYFRYEKDLADVVKGLSCEVYQGEVFALMGGNGMGKTTVLHLIKGLFQPQRGKVTLNNQTIGVLPQNPETLFIKKTVELDLYDMLSQQKLSEAEKTERIEEVIELCELAPLLNRHPFDLSGGEKQKMALAKILLSDPQILLLDEPTKGLDAHYKESFGEILEALKLAGKTVVIVSHDVEFCAKYADRCALMFDGQIVSEGIPSQFFANKSFYTTAANRMSRGIIDGVVLAEDILERFGKLPTGSVSKKREFNPPQKAKEENPNQTKTKKITPLRIFKGLIFTVLFAVTYFFVQRRCGENVLPLIYGAELLFCGLALQNFLPQKDNPNRVEKLPKQKRNFSKRTFLSILMVLVAIPLTMYIGIYFLGDRKYYFISMLIILEIMLPFLISFEGEKRSARELVVISVICTIAVCGREVFSMLPQFKPTLAIVIIAGIAFGGETGFLVGAVVAFVSNFFFGQGPWTPWQMFTTGIVGFLGGILFQKGFIQKNKVSLALFGGMSTVLVYGGIMNPASVIMYQAKPNAEMILAAYKMGLPFDIIHGVSTMFFLWFISEPFLEKLDRIKTKYGILQ